VPVRSKSSTRSTSSSKRMSEFSWTMEEVAQRCSERHRRLRAVWRATKRGRYAGV
jgi:hypothetical protein